LKIQSSGAEAISEKNDAFLLIFLPDQRQERKCSINVSVLNAHIARLFAKNASNNSCDGDFPPYVEHAIFQQLIEAGSEWRKPETILADDKSNKIIGGGRKENHAKWNKRRTKLYFVRFKFTK
jgi:hypothetical protein